MKREGGGGKKGRETKERERGEEIEERKKGESDRQKMRGVKNNAIKVNRGSSIYLVVM